MVITWRWPNVWHGYGMVDKGERERWQWPGTDAEDAEH